MTNPKVSILCITYNQHKYIKQTLDGFLSQKTNFDFEILINDDASTDGTVDILKHYQSQYPDIIKLNLQKDNLYSRGIRCMFARFLFPLARGDYIALCEGDDYWMDDNKLQSQVDFLEKNNEYSLVFHPVKVINTSKKAKLKIFPDRTDHFSVRELLEANFIQTNSVLYRSRKNYRNLKVDVVPGDWYLHLYHAQHGKIGFINKIMAVYRRHDQGIWWANQDNMDAIWRDHGLNHLALCLEQLKMYPQKEFNQIIYNSIGQMLHNIINTCINDNEDPKAKVSEVIKRFNSNLDDLIIGLYYINLNNALSLASSKKVIAELEQRNSVIDGNNKQLLNSINRLNQELNLIKNSKTWKIRSKINKVIKR